MREYSCSNDKLLWFGAGAFCSALLLLIVLSMNSTETFVERIDESSVAPSDTPAAPSTEVVPAPSDTPAAPSPEVVPAPSETRVAYLIPASSVITKPSISVKQKTKPKLPTRPRPDRWAFDCGFKMKSRIVQYGNGTATLVACEHNPPKTVEPTKQVSGKCPTGFHLYKDECVHIANKNITRPYGCDVGYSRFNGTCLSCPKGHHLSLINKKITCSADSLAPAVYRM